MTLRSLVPLTASEDAIPAARSLRVLFVLPGDGQGSSMIFARRQAECLAAEGVEAPIFYLGSRTSPVRLLGEMVRFRSEIARQRPDVVHAHFGTMTALFSALGCGMLPLVITYRGSDLNPPPASYSWKAKLRATWGRLFSQLASLRARRIVCVSRRLSNHLWWRRGGVAILPSGVDADVFCPEPRLGARRRLGWSDAESVALFHAGRDSKVKRLDLALAAVSQARRKVPSLRLEILDGSVSPARIPLLMNAADCLLLTSVSEGSPSVVQEALASNLPILSVAVGDVEERLAGVDHSIIAIPDAAVLGRALARLVDPPRRSDGRKKLPQFCARRLARELKDIYREILKERA
jgi:teichuronic acid biosynthesis glycosyltransferase TuaC